MLNEIENENSENKNGNGKVSKVNKVKLGRPRKRGRLIDKDKHTDKGKDKDIDKSISTGKGTGKSTGRPKGRSNRGKIEDKRKQWEQQTPYNAFYFNKDNGVHGNPLDAVLAVASAVRTGTRDAVTRTTRLSVAAVAERTRVLWKSASYKQRVAMQLIGSSSFSSSQVIKNQLKQSSTLRGIGGVPVEEENPRNLILSTIQGPEPNKEGKIKFSVVDVCKQQKERELTGHDRKEMSFGRTIVRYERDSFGARAKAVLASPEARKALWLALKAQKIKN